MDTINRRAAIALLTSVFGTWSGATVARSESIVVGGKDFTEQQILTEMTAQYLEAKGVRVGRRSGLSTRGVRMDQEAGLIDLYWEYTGTSLVVFNGVREPLGREEGFDRVRKLDASKGLVWLAPSKVENSYALAMRRSDAQEAGISTISDVAAQIRTGRRFRLAVNTEFFTRADGLQPLQQLYRFDVEPQRVVRTEASKIYEMLRDGSVDMGLVFSTDGRVSAFHLVLLDDDKRFFPSYLLAPVVRQSTLSRNPELSGMLNAISAKLDNATMARLNAQADLDNKAVEEVARRFLIDAGLL